MKNKFKYIYLIHVFLLLICLGSCGKVKKLTNVDYGKIDYYVAGVYIEVEDYEEFEMNDANPKVYFDFSKTSSFGFLSTKTGYDKSAALYNLISKSNTQKGGKDVYYANVNMTFVNEDVVRFTLYPIYVDKNNELIINQEISEQINISGNMGYLFYVDFENNDKNYNIQISLSINKK